MNGGRRWRKIGEEEVKNNSEKNLDPKRAVLWKSG
jgi:hypothetical protein